jgi:cell wall-associated NlpC family hydrolase
MSRTLPRSARILRVALRTMAVCSFLLATAACGSKQYSTRQTLADNPPAPGGRSAAERLLVTFEPASPFLRFGGSISCPPVDPGRAGGVRNPFEPADSRRLIALAFSQIGTLYRPGGAEPRTGFDCSGFTTWLFGKVGVNLPRNSGKQFHTGREVDKSRLRKGDLVFFGNGNHITHVGIYLEGHKFIHCSSSGDTVKISSLDAPVWEAQYSGARRVF